MRVKQRGITGNFLLNVSGTILPLATALITVPIYIAHVGAARYGILAVVWLLLGYFGFLDFGLSRASANALSKLGHAGPAERAPVLVTALCLNMVLGVVGGAILYIASGLLMSRFAHLTPSLSAEVSAAMPWIACMLPVALISATGTGAIESRERFLASNVFQTFGGVLGQVAPVVCALLIGPSLAVVIPAAFLARLVSTIAIWAFVLVTEHPVDPRRFSRERVRELLGYGAWVSVSSGLSPLLATSDQLLIGALLGPASIAHYSVPMNLGRRSQILALALGKTLFPRMSRLGPEEARKLTGRAFVTLAYGFGAVCGPAILLSGPFLRLWLGADFAGHAVPVAQILLVGMWTNGIAFMPFGLLQGQGRPDLGAKIHAAEIVPFLAVLYLLVEKFGLPGAAIAFTLRTSIDCLIMLRAAHCWTAQVARALPALGLIGLCWLAARLLPASLPVSIACATAMGIAIVAVGFAVDPASRATALGLLPARLRLRARTLTPHRAD